MKPTICNGCGSVVDCHICNMQKINEIVDWINARESYGPTKKFVEDIPQDAIDAWMDRVKESLEKDKPQVEPELKPCPFCGGNPVEQFPNTVGCGQRDCEANEWCMSTEAWNRRA